MRSTRVIAGFALLSFLGACSAGAPIPPEEVIKRAVIHSHTVESVTMAISADVHTERNAAISGSLVIQGIVRSGGQAWSADTSFSLESTLSRGHERASGRVVVVSPGDGSMYLRPESLEGILGDVIKRSLTGSLNGWWKTAGGSEATQTSRHTVDPAVLAGYADAITVLEDLGIEKDSSGRKQYHFRVALKTEALSEVPGDSAAEGSAAVAGDGELWIDAEKYSLTRALWNLRGIPTTAGPASVKADIQLSGYDSAPQIQRPAGSASILPIESIFAIFSADR